MCIIIFIYQGLISLSLDQANKHHLHVLNHGSRLVGKRKRQNKQQTVLIQIWNKIRRGIFRVNRVMTLLVHF